LKLADHLSDKQKQQLDKLNSPKKKTKIPDLDTGGKTEKPMSRKDWEELMGTRRDTYTRRNGAVRRK
jgi:hypothetical protein